MRSYKYLQSVPWITPFDGETPPANPPVNPQGTQQATPQAGEQPKMFTQEEVNRIVAENTRKQRQEIEKTVQDLERLRKSKELTEKQREELASRIEQLNNQLLTKEELAAKEKERLSREHATVVEALTKERETWRNRFTSSTITQKITDAAVAADAYNPAQLVAFLQPHTHLIADVDAEGNETGSFTPKVKFSDTDKDGKAVVLDLTIPEAIKRMKEMDQFANLFKAGVAGGLGVKPERGAGRGSEPDPANMTPEQYRKWRLTQPRYAGAPRFYGQQGNR